MGKRWIVVAAIGFILILCLTLPAVSEEKTTPEELKGYKENVEKSMKEWKVPGAAISIVKDGKIVFAEGFGYRDVKNALKVTPNTIFAIGSCSKAFASGSMAILVDEGKVGWDKPVREYLPTFKLKDPFASEGMTPKDLLCHNSGLPRHDAIWYGSKENRSQIYKRLQYLEPSRDFRTTFQYNNLMFMTAGYLVGQVMGITWEKFTEDRIFRPLGMKDSNFSVEDSQKMPDYALPYSLEDDKVKEIPFRNIDNIGPAGSINSNVIDMAQWVLLHLNKGKIGEKTIISEAALKMTHTPQMTMGLGMMPGFEAYTEILHDNYGLGWMITPYRGHLLLHHGGGIDGFTAYVSFMPHDNIGVVVLTNLSGGAVAMTATFNAYERLLGIRQTPWDERFKKVFDSFQADADKANEEKDKDRVPDTTPTHPLRDYAGEYENPGYGVFTVEMNGDRLKAVYNAIEEPLDHYHYDIFKFRQSLVRADRLVSFSMDNKGNINKLAVQLESAVDPIVFTKLPEKTMQERTFLEQFVGEYEVQGITFSVTLKGENTLVASVPGQGEMELVPYKGMEFNLKGMAGAGIEFVKDESGKVIEAILKQPGASLTAKKKQK
jgi:CubicO group peptidase (beta-lactamase class C family)